VNVCPSLSSSSPLDSKIKTSLICDIMNLVGPQPYDKKKEVKRFSVLDNLGVKNNHSKNINDVIDLNADNCY
jgi:tubulin polyglutamylase TTLL4